MEPARDRLMRAEERAGAVRRRTRGTGGHAAPWLQAPVRELKVLAAGDTPETILQGYPWLEPEDIRACLAYARRLVGHERVVPVATDRST